MVLEVGNDFLFNILQNMVEKYYYILCVIIAQLIFLHCLNHAQLLYMIDHDICWCQNINKGAQSNELVWILDFKQILLLLLLLFVCSVYFILSVKLPPVSPFYLLVMSSLAGPLTMHRRGQGAPVGKHCPRGLFNDIPRVGAYFYDIPWSRRSLTTYPGQDCD